MDLARGIAIAALSVSIVTAAVTFGRTQPAGTFQAVIVNNKTGSQHEYTRRTWPDQARCDAAIKGLNERLASIAKLNPDNLTDVAAAPDADPTISGSLDQLVVYIVMNTGVVPNFSISCKLKADRV